MLLLTVAGDSLGDRSPSVAYYVPPDATQPKPKRGAVQSFRSRPDLRPPTVRVTTKARDTAPGYVFVAPFTFTGSRQSGPMVVDNRGEAVWFHPLCGQTPTDLRVQQYRGEPVLTWWQGRPTRGWGNGEYVIADGSYRELARVKAGRGRRGDLHDFLVTPQGTGLLTIYDSVRRNLSPVGGPRRGTVMDSVLQEVDIETGTVLFEWHSLNEVGLRESYKKVSKKSGDPWDHFHINSVHVDTDGNLLVSARNTHAVYKINRKTGAIMWRLGGKRSDFKMGKGSRFAWQHDAHRQPDGTITIFDNGASPKVRSQSRGIVLALDENARRATLVREYEHPRGLLAANKANMQTLANGNVFIGWGAEPYFSEFSRAGKLLFDARYPRGYDSYRAYRFPWAGRPSDPPSVAARTGDSGVTVYASWNGATDVASWQVLAGASPNALGPVGSASRDGFETAIRVQTDESYVAVQALSVAGQVLGTSRALKPGGGAGGAAISATAKGVQRILRQGGVTASVRCSSGSCTVTARAAVEIPSARRRSGSTQSLSLGCVKRSVPAGVRRSVKLRASRTVRRAIRRALRRRSTRRRLRAKLRITVTDASGNRLTRQRTVRLR